MNRQTALLKAWAKYVSRNVPSDAIAPAATHEVGFKSGFNTAWDALMAEIRPLVDRIYTVNLYERHATEGDRAHNAAVERLRELVREGELGAEMNPTKLGDYKIHTSLTERGNLRVKIETKDSQTEFFVSPELTVSSDEASDKE